MKAKALATYDDANVIAQKLRVLGIPTNLLGRYCEISSSEVCSLLNGAKKLTKIRKLQFENMIRDLELVAAAVNPVPVDFRNTEAVLNALVQFKSGTLLIGVNRFGQTRVTPEIDFSNKG